VCSLRHGRQLLPAYRLMSRDAGLCSCSREEFLREDKPNSAKLNQPTNPQTKTCFIFLITRKDKLALCYLTLCVGEDSEANFCILLHWSYPSQSINLYLLPSEGTLSGHWKPNGGFSSKLTI
jgi:hypothetical protein